MRPTRPQCWWNTTGPGNVYISFTFPPFPAVMHSFDGATTMEFSFIKSQQKFSNAFPLRHTALYHDLALLGNDRNLIVCQAAAVKTSHPARNRPASMHCCSSYCNGFNSSQSGSNRKRCLCGSSTVTGNSSEGGCRRIRSSHGSSGCFSNGVAKCRIN